MDQTWGSTGSPATVVDGRGPQPYLGSLTLRKERQNPGWFLDRASRAHLDPMPPLQPTEDNLRAGLKTKYSHLRGSYPKTYERLAKGMSRQPPSSWPELFAAGDSRAKPAPTSPAAWAPGSSSESFFGGHGSIGTGAGGWAEDKATRQLLCRTVSAASALAPPSSQGGRSSCGRSSSAGLQDTASADDADLLRALRRAKGKPRDPWFGNLRINPDVFEKVG